MLSAVLLLILHLSAELQATPASMLMKGNYSLIGVHISMVLDAMVHDRCRSIERF